MPTDLRDRLGDDGFRRVITELEAFGWRPDVNVEEIGTPQRIAPYGYALEAELGTDAEEYGSGRLILLHDPAGNDTWDGDWRIVTLVRAGTDADMVADSLIAEVAWSWLVEALGECGAVFTAPAGTVTTVTSRSFGSMSTEANRDEIEIRASWTPLINDPSDITGHLRAWQQLMCQAAGMPPLPEKVTPIRVNLSVTGTG
ncbi:DUF3000 domain-containing protein [Propionibacterium australiense]|uniref:DUF3000 family protein n=1 Tax=Propionibacterium australiense TaxID=119981 RepID=A0A383SAU5_9ACTN|nr:DUF3000 domain-containing protein [Propionibacterium australiense]RLP06884.1 DUF3000 family protein [Propionibacterium australiense]RLP08845.1 DUF3000 family protein [Propionibacterium australiense]SYZ34346.1 Protein of unknown function DUF3000 [Propionibacterium australiense]VEH90061.1 Protein of uncharacterised function (DUF3000) [Propionibacterium australiense]